MTKLKNEWRTIGEVRVNSATLVICDPCRADKAFDWWRDEFCGMNNDNLMKDKSSRSAELANDNDAIAVAVKTGLGDGVYQVQARYENDPTFGRRCAEISIKFLPHPQLGGIGW